MKEKSVRGNLKKVLEKQQKELSKALRISNITPYQMFQHLHPNYYSTFIEELTEEQVKDFLNDLEQFERDIVFDFLPDCSLFDKVILPKDMDTSFFEFISDERLKELLNDYLDGPELNELFIHLFFKDKCRFVKLLDDETRLNWLNYCWKDNQRNNYFFSFINDLDYSDEKEQIYEKLVVLRPELLARLFEQDNDGLFTINVLEQLPEDDKIAVFDNIQTEFLHFVVSKDDYLVMRYPVSKRLNDLIVCNLEEDDFEEFFENVKSWNVFLPDYFEQNSLKIIYSQCPEQRAYIVREAFVFYGIKEVIELYYLLDLSGRLEMLNILLSDEVDKKCKDVAFSILEYNKNNLDKLEKIAWETLK